MAVVCDYRRLQVRGLNDFLQPKRSGEMSGCAVYLFSTNNETMPAAINGPTGTPRNSATPIMVPINKPPTMVGWALISETPRPPSQETKIPTAIASSDFQSRKDLIRVLEGNDPLASGAITAIVRMIIPKVIPCFST